MATIKQTFNVPDFLSNNIITVLDLAADANAGQNQATFINVEGIASNDWIVFSPNTEKAEIVQVQSISGQTITFTGNLVLNHKNHETVKKLFGNQIQVWRGPNVDGTIPNDSTFVVLGSPITIQPDQPYTQVTDAAASSDWWYKFTYHNPTSGADTDLSEAEAVRGGGYGDLCSIQDIIDESGLNDVHTDPSLLAGYRAESQSEVNGGLASAGYLIPLQTATGALFTPANVTGITKRLAAGFALSRNYGTVKPGNAKNGLEKRDEARQAIAMIQLNDVLLLDSTGQQLAKTQLVSGYPDDSTTQDPATDDSDIMASMTKRF
jgi:hypothetical protein